MPSHQELMIEDPTIDAAFVRYAIKKHRDEVARQVARRWPNRGDRPVVAALDCLLALVEGREWVPSSPPIEEPDSA